MAKKEADDFLGENGIVTTFARMWPRGVFDYPGKNKKFLASDLTILDEPGVYVLYREDLPYYIGKTDDRLFERLFFHAKRPEGRYYYFWNYFSVFVIKDPKDRTMVEGILIAAMPTANSAKPQAFDRHPMPPEVTNMMRDQREHRAKLGRGQAEAE
jgi:hypothetical protein